MIEAFILDITGECDFERLTREFISIVTSGTVVMVNTGMDLISTWIIIIAMLFIQC